MLSNHDVTSTAQKINNRIVHLCGHYDRFWPKVEIIIFVFCVIYIQIIFNVNTDAFKKKQDCIFLFNKVIAHKRFKAVKMTVTAVIV